MRFAIIADIHANLPALEAVLEDIAQRDISATYHLGDLVGYAPWPNETVELLRQKAIPGVSGNYDSTVAADYKHCGCRYEDPLQEELSHVSFDWTKRNSSPATKKFLGALPFRLDLKPAGGHTPGRTITLVHGTPTLNTLYWTQDKSDSFCRQMARTAQLESGDAVLFGHTHKPWSRTLDGIHFVNAGSAGRPKDGDWRACYVVVDASETALQFDFVRVEYDVDRAMRAIRASDLPDHFAEQLRSGGALADV